MMNRLATLICLASTALGAVTFRPHNSDLDSGCGTGPYFPRGTTKNEETSEGREFRVWLPVDYDETEATPLILSFHGKHGTIDQQLGVDRLTKPEFNKDHIVIYLQGVSI